MVLNYFIRILLSNLGTNIWVIWIWFYFHIFYLINHFGYALFLISSIFWRVNSLIFILRWLTLFNFVILLSYFTFNLEVIAFYLFFLNNLQNIVWTWIRCYFINILNLFFFDWLTKLDFYLFRKAFVGLNYFMINIDSTIIQVFYESFNIIRRWIIKVFCLLGWYLLISTAYFLRKFFRRLSILIVYSLNDASINFMGNKLFFVNFWCLIFNRVINYLNIISFFFNFNKFIFIIL